MFPQTGLNFSFSENWKKAQLLNTWVHFPFALKSLNNNIVKNNNNTEVLKLQTSSLSQKVLSTNQQTMQTYTTLLQKQSAGILTLQSRTAEHRRKQFALSFLKKLKEHRARLREDRETLGNAWGNKTENHLNTQQLVWLKPLFNNDVFRRLR